MKVFISWSGERSEALAKSLREWLPLVLYFVEPWLSQSDIQAGERWGVEVAKELEACNFGIICVTRDNLVSPWILFEAGALAKSMQEGRVIPLLLDLDFKEISGPLAQFQAKKAEQNGIREIVTGLNKASASPVAEAQLEKLLAALWTDLEKQISSIPKSGTPEKKLRPQGEILEELVAGIRNVEMRVRDAMEDDFSRTKRRKFKYHEMMMMEAMHRVADGPRDPIQILVLAGFLRDEMPWVYELALDAYKAVKSGKKAAAKAALTKFLRSVEVLQEGPFGHEIGISRRMIHMLMHETIPFLEMQHLDNDGNALSPPRRRRSVSEQKKD